MEPFDYIFQDSNDAPTRLGQEHSVIVHFYYGMEELDPLHELDMALDAKIEAEGVGKYDYHEIAMDGTDGFLFMYGPNADLLFKTALPILERTHFMRGAVATLRFGPLNVEASEIDVEIHVRNQ